MTLNELGPRICILGPSNSGKSTLAAAISRARNLPAIHLDKLYHLPNTDWEPRRFEEFLALHNEAVLGGRWVIDGNYTRCLPARLTRATGLILLDTSTVTSLLRYFRRSWFEPHRHGALEGCKDSVKWDMIHHITIATPKNRKRYKELFNSITIPKIMLATKPALSHFYQTEQLSA